jgi:hypothetical protein
MSFEPMTGGGAVTVPDWLNLRDGSLTPGVQSGTIFVSFGGQPHYRLDVRPAAGRHTCAITQTENGRRLDEGKPYVSVDAALAGGLEELRAKLGW